MDLININDKIRNIISESVENLKIKNDTEEECINEFITNLYGCLDGEKEIDENLLEMIIKVSFSDAVKVLIFRIKSGIANDMDIIKFSNLKDIEDYTSLLAEVSADPSLFQYIIENCYVFCNTNYFGRINIINKLSTIENKWLFGISTTHSMDLMTYKNVKLKNIIEYTRNEIAYQNKNFSTEVSDANVLSIIGCIKSIVVSCPENISNSLLFDIGVIDYSVSKYLNSKIKDDEMLLTRIDFYENYRVEEILFWLRDNEEFLKQSIWMLYSLYFDKAYGDIELSEEILNSDSTIQIKKKLALN